MARGAGIEKILWTKLWAISYKSKCALSVAVKLANKFASVLFLFPPPLSLSLCLFLTRTLSRWVCVARIYPALSARLSPSIKLIRNASNWKRFLLTVCIGANFCIPSTKLGGDDKRHINSRICDIYGSLDSYRIWHTLNQHTNATIKWIIFDLLTWFACINLPIRYNILTYIAYSFSFRFVDLTKNKIAVLAIQSPGSCSTQNAE